MSGGAWDYQSHRLRNGEIRSVKELGRLMRLLGDLEHEVDWAECCDTDPVQAARQCYLLCLAAFEELWGDDDACAVGARLNDARERLARDLREVSDDGGE